MLTDILPFCNILAFDWSVLPLLEIMPLYNGGILRTSEVQLTQNSVSHVNFTSQHQQQ